MAQYISDDGLRLRCKVRAVVQNGRGQVLLIRPHGYRIGTWTLAGGGVEHDETPHDAICRELAEELGLLNTAKLEQLSVRNRFIYSSAHKQKRALDHDGQDAVMFACEVANDAVLTLQATEIADAGWFSPAQAVDVLPVREQQLVLEACLREIADRRNNSGSQASAERSARPPASKSTAEEFEPARRRTLS